MSLRTDYSIIVRTKVCYKFILNEHEFHLLLSCFAHLRFRSYTDEFFSRVSRAPPVQENDRSRFLEPRVAAKRLETRFLERDKSRFNKATLLRVHVSRILRRLRVPFDLGPHSHRPLSAFPFLYHTPCILILIAFSRRIPRLPPPMPSILLITSFSPSAFIFSRHH